jgi:gamma-glutamyltranspeptidase/glutathione hydrolase
MKRICALLLLCATSALAREPLRAPRVMVATTSEPASAVGADILRKGGNAVDAAIAVSFALAVTWPPAGNLGGGGFMLIRKADGTEEALDYRERAPLAATRTMYLDAEGNVIKDLSVKGYKAVGVPGTVAGMALAHKRHGKLKWADLVEPARKLAAEGFIVNYHLATFLQQQSTIDRLAPFPESRRIYQRNGKFYEMGERLLQPELAETLTRIRDLGADGFYRGVTAKRIAEEMRTNGGLITEEDLRRYEPSIRKPLHGTYRGYEIVTMPPPSSGGIALIEMLNMLEAWDVKALRFQSAQHMHTFIEVMRRAFADRAEFLGDPDFMSVPVARLISKEYAAERRKDIDPLRASDSLRVRAGNVAPASAGEAPRQRKPAPRHPRPESTETTHFSIVDPQGNVVSSTYTINDWFGSGVTIKGTGVLMNNEMDDFTSKPGIPNEYGLIQGEGNAIAPGKRPLSSMTPTIVLKDGKVLLLLGAAGGPTIITAVLHIITNLVDFGRTLQDAIDAPRFHHQWLPDHIYWEEFGVNPDTRAILEKMGHRFREIPGNARVPSSIADAHAVMIDPQTGMRMGASDPRRGGVAIGW